MLFHCTKYWTLFPPSSEAIDTITDHITRIFKSAASETLSQKIRNFQGENSTNHGLDRPAKLHVKNITEREIFIIVIIYIFSQKTMNKYIYKHRKTKCK